MHLDCFIWSAQLKDQKKSGRGRRRIHRASPLCQPRSFDLVVAARAWPTAVVESVQARASFSRPHVAGQSCEVCALGVWVSRTIVLTTFDAVCNAVHVTVDGRRARPVARSCGYNVALFEAEGITSEQWFEPSTGLALPGEEVIFSTRLGASGPAVQLPAYVLGVCQERGRFLVEASVATVLDAALPHGILVKGETLVGLVSHVSEESNSGDGYTLQAVPSTFVHAALTQWHAGVAIGPATLPLTLQLATNSAMREFLRAGAEPGGVLVIGSVGDHYPVQAGDLLLRVEGLQVLADAAVDAGDHGSVFVFLDYVAACRSPEETLTTTLLRDGGARRAVVPLIFYLSRPRPWSPPVDTARVEHGGADYQIVSGLVFTELSNGYIAEFGPEWTAKAPQELVFRIEQRQLPAVVLCEILADPATAGLASLQHRTLTSVNGARVRTLLELRDALRKTTGYTAFEFSDGAHVAFETGGLSESTRRVLERHNIRRSALRPAQAGPTAVECG